MFGDELLGKGSPSSVGNSLEGIQYELYGSYMRQASEKILAREAEIIAGTELLLERMVVQSQQKELTQLCTTQASLYTSRVIDDRSSCRSKQLRGAFKRKSKLGNSRRARGGMTDAIQEIREVCTEKTIFWVENLFQQYERVLEEQQLAEYRQGAIKRKRDRCDNCVAKESQLQMRTQQFQEKIIKLNIEIQRLQGKCEQQERSIKEGRFQEQERVDRQKAIFDNCREYLIQKQGSISGKHTELKLIQRQLCNAIQRVSETGGCRRCELVRSIKGQLFQYRRFYEREYQKLQKLFGRYRRIFK